MPHIDRESLELFVGVVDIGSINAVAAKAGRSQQAVSERMRRLEESLGLDLLERGARGSRPTEIGKLVADWAADLLAAYRTFNARIDSLRADSNVDLWVAASQTIAGYLLPAWIGTMKTSGKNGATSPHVHAVNSVEVMREVRDGTVSVGFIETLDLPTDLAMRTVGHDELVVVVAPNHPWAALPGGVTPAELARTPLVVREEGSGTRQALETLLAEFDQSLKVVPPAAEFSAVMSVRGAVEAGIAPSVMSAITVADDLVGGRLVRVPVRGLELRRPLTAVWREDRVLPTAALELVEIAGRANSS
ncbi:LysR family transcriptional regulator [Gulosibacter molinativorax]|uniref:LysR family transcriptional regulator n=1 Tax=Gulosibacter molinativorax TaxID=256821 RepID=A0ABT7C9Z8_9MICO|nr:LysR family transcriptional regulator [Gulosibacter molinativorax]MDJ1372023.1 LysR family transcriptional regulator [Gulosibacter molinativorax]QUY60733.1 HTH-type transcriptional regulator CysL [Gulosibacter molinativorax]